MAPPVSKKKKFSSDNRRLISYTAIGVHEQQSMGSFVTLLGKRRSLRVAKKLNRPLWSKLKRWVCNEVLMDSLPFFGRSQLGLKLALVSPRFDALVDRHFNGETEFPLPDRPLPIKIRFKDLWIVYIDHFVVEFLRANQKIWDKGIKLNLNVWSHKNNIIQSIWDVLAPEIWPIFASNIRCLSFYVSHLDNLRRLISPTILTDLNNISEITSGRLFPDGIADDGPNATAGQALSKWLHTPTKDGQPKRLRCGDYISESTEWINSFTEEFLRATTCASYIMSLLMPVSAQIVPFELINEQTREKLMMEKGRVFWNDQQWVMKRCQIGKTIQWEDGNLPDQLSNVIINFNGDKKCIGPLLSVPISGG